MDMGNDQLDLESVIRKDVPAHVDNPMAPHQEEDIEEDGVEKPFSSHEGEEEEECTSREDDQEKKRKRDEKFDRKHPKD